jgi:ribonuclease HI
VTLHAFTDGASRGNPGESGIGIRLTDAEGRELMAVGRFIGRATNNAAEYTALLTCLEIAAGFPCDRLIVHSDSELLVRQMTGIYKVKNPRLRSCVHRVQERIAQSPFRVEFRHIPREENRLADELANKALNLRGDVTG